MMKFDKTASEKSKTRSIIYVKCGRKKAERRQEHSSRSTVGITCDRGLKIAVARATPFYLFRFILIIPFSVCNRSFYLSLFFFLIYWKHLNTVFFRTPILYNLKTSFFVVSFCLFLTCYDECKVS